MKNLFLGLALLTSAFAAQANCIPTFQTQFDKVNARFEQEQKKIHNASIVGNVIAGISVSASFAYVLANPVEVAAIILSGPAAANTDLVSIAIWGTLPFELTIASTIYDGIVPDDDADLNAQRRDLVASLALLREAEVGNGQVLQNLMEPVWNQVGGDVSPSDLADAILSLNEKDEFCKDGVLDNANTIFNKTLKTMK